MPPEVRREPADYRCSPALFPAGDSPCECAGRDISRAPRAYTTAGRRYWSSGLANPILGRERGHQGNPLPCFAPPFRV